MLKKILTVILIVGGILGFIAYDKYNLIMSPNVPNQLENNIVNIN